MLEHGLNLAIVDPIKQQDQNNEPRRAGVVQRRLQIVNISWGSKPGDAVGMHVAAWVLGESLMHLATVWSPAEVCAPCSTTDLGS